MKKILLLSLFPVLLFSCGNEEINSDEVTGSEYVHIPPALPNNILDSIRPGDIIIRKGNGPLSYHLMAHTKEDYSHCGVIVKDKGEWKVIHTIGGTASEKDDDGVQLILLKDFVGHAADSMLYICRPIFNENTDTLGDLITDRAYHYLDQRVPFDHGFSMFSTEKYYCTELLYYIFKDVHEGNVFVVEKKHKSYMLMFSTFFRKNNFKPIYHLRGDKYQASASLSHDSL